MLPTTHLILKRLDGWMDEWMNGRIFLRYNTCSRRTSCLVYILSTQKKPSNYSKCQETKIYILQCASCRVETTLKEHKYYYGDTRVFNFVKRLQQYVRRLCKNIFHLQVLVIYFFATPPIKLKSGQQIGVGVLIANHLDQS